MRRIALTLVLLSLPVGVWADRHRAGAGGGGGGVNKSTLYGFQLTGELVLKHFGRQSPSDLTFSAVAEFARMSGDHDGGSLTQSTFVAGGRLTLNVLRQIQPYGHGLIGGYWAEGENSSATVLGGGLDIPLGKAGPADHPPLVFRVQIDHFWINSPEHSYPQFTGQIIYRFE